MFDYEKYYEEQSNIKFEHFDLGHELPEKNIFALYSPSLNTFLMVDYRYNLLRKIRLILSSKIRLEIINLSLNTKNFNDPILTNYNSIFYKPIKSKGFQPTHINVKAEINFIISKNKCISKKELDKITDIQEYLFFCQYVILQYYFFFSNIFVSYNMENSLEEIYFLKNIFNDSNMDNFFEKELSDIKKKLFLVNIIDNCLFISNNKSVFFNNAREKFMENKDILLRDYKIESLVIGDFIGIFKE